MSQDLTVPLAVSARPGNPQPLKAAGPCTMVILGASGDLTRRKLMPALFHLMGDGLLSDDFEIIGVGRQDMSDTAFRDTLCDATGDSAADWPRFAERIRYVGGNLNDAALYTRLKGLLGAHRGHLFYLALPPGVYATTLTHLADSGLAPRIAPDNDAWVRIVIEKPFGHDLASAQALNQLISSRFAEHQIFRIDHYLGKDTVRNLLVFRFANSLFEPAWDREHIHHVQITAAETVGVEHRAGYYEHAGVVRDMFQNHLLQLLALTALDPPASFACDNVRNAKNKVLSAIRPMTGAEVTRHAVRGQYRAGFIDGKPVAGYRAEPGVARDSTTATFAAIRLLIDNERWRGVPFFLRSGKRMARRLTEIAIQFREPPHSLFTGRRKRGIPANVLVFRIQPDEGISVSLEVKAPGVDLDLATARMDMSYAARFGPPSHTAYETLLLDCMLGDATLFMRSDMVENAWRVVDPITTTWERSAGSELATYTAGQWGPRAADAITREDGAVWRAPAGVAAAAS